MTMSLLLRQYFVGLCIALSFTQVLSVTATTTSGGDDKISPDNPHRHERSLSRGPTCPHDHNKIKDSVWYELEMSVSSAKPLDDCTAIDWNELRRFLESELKSLQLYPEFGITDLNPDICPIDPEAGRRLELGNDELSGKHIEPAELIADRRSLLEISPIVFHLFYKGGGKCYFCRDDDGDNNSGGGRRLLIREQEEAKKPMLRRRKETHAPKRDSKNEISALWLEKDNDDEDFFLNSKDLPKIISRENINVTSPYLLTDNPPTRRRQLRCGGCFHLDFSRDGHNNKITGTPYLRPGEYWYSHGVYTRAFPTRGTGYAPYNMARIFDTGYPNKDPDLGSPNHKCPGGGPGRGIGGEPSRNGKVNPGANCRPQGNLIIIQQDRSSHANDSRRGGTIRFDFAYPVTLNRIGLMDMDEDVFDFIDVYTESGDKHKHKATGYGDNSIETIELNRKKVKRLEIRFPGSGAVRFIDFCHDCGDLERLREQAVEKHYPDPDERSYENLASVFHFTGMLPDLNAALSTRMEHAVNRNYRNDRSHCLYRQDIAVNVKITPSTPIGANDCTNQ